MLTRTKVAIRLGLGILCGLALVLVPLVFSTSTPTNALPHPATTNTTNPYLSTGHAQSSNITGGPSAVPYSGASFSLGNLSALIIILFILVPSVVFSLVIRKWAEKRARDYL